MADAKAAEKAEAGKKAEVVTAKPAGKKKMIDEKVVLYPFMTEKVVRLGDRNKIAFVVDRRADKGDIKRAIENLYAVKVKKVNTEITPEGRKKAYVELTKEFSAMELANKLGML